MEDLAAALAFANYQSTLTQQKNILRQKFQDDCILAQDGGLFLVTPEFIAGLQAIQTTTRYVLDMNLNPILIEDISQLVKDALHCYETAITAYGTEYSKIKTQRSVKALVGL
jgi:hypothetical protein